MSLFFHGRVTHDYMISGIVVSVIVASIVIYLITLSQRMLLEAEERKQTEDELKMIIDTSCDAFWLVDEKGRIVSVNNEACKLYGYSREEFIGKQANELDWQLPEDETSKVMQDGLSNNKHTFQSKHVTNNGRLIDVEISTSLFRNKRRGTVLVAFVRDITQRKKAHDDLRESEERFRALVTNAPIVFFRINKDGIFTLLEGRGLEPLGLKPGQVVNQSLSELFHDVPEIIENNSLALKGETVRYVSNLGDSWFDTLLSPVMDDDGNVQGVFGIANDITDRKKAEDEINISLKEKEVLLKEVHHRVKNNLQIISSILHMKEVSTSTPEVAEALKANRNRIYSMAMVHEKLYEKESISKVDLREYIVSLVSNISETYSTGDIPIEVDVEPVILNLDQLIPCGLILNELITNAVKYAFKDSGTINVKVALTEEERVELSVKDKGPGLPEEPDFDNAESLGFILLSSLSQQLGGILDYCYDDGALFVVRFTKEQVSGG